MDEALDKKLGELLLRLKNDDSSVLADIDQLVGKRLRAYANMYYVQMADVDDAVQSFLYKLYYASKKFKENKHAYAWMIKVFKNLILSQIKHSKTEREYVRQSVEALKSDIANMSEDYLENYIFYKDVLSKLDSYEQYLLINSIILELSLFEIANQLSKPKSTIEYQVSKLKEKLRNMGK